MLPALDRNPSRPEAAVLATQLFYSGVLQFQSGRLKEAAGDLREAERLAQAHSVWLPWLDRLIPYYHRIAEGVVQENHLNLAADLWRHVLELDQAAYHGPGTAWRCRVGKPFPYWAGKPMVVAYSY